MEEHYSSFNDETSLAVLEPTETFLLEEFPETSDDFIISLQEHDEESITRYFDFEPEPDDASDPLVQYRKEYSHLTRGQLSKENAALYERLRRAKKLQFVPTQTRTDPLEEYQKTYSYLSRGQLRRANPALYKRIRTAGKLDQIATKKRVIIDPVAEYEERYGDLAIGQLKKADGSLYNRLRRDGKNMEIRHEVREFADPVEYYRMHYAGLTRGELNIADGSLYNSLRGADLLYHVPLNAPGYRLVRDARAFIAEIPLYNDNCEYTIQRGDINAISIRDIKRTRLLTLEQEMLLFIHLSQLRKCLQQQLSKEESTRQIIMDSLASVGLRGSDPRLYLRDGRSHNKKALRTRMILAERARNKDASCIGLIEDFPLSDSLLEEIVKISQDSSTHEVWNAIGELKNHATVLNLRLVLWCAHGANDSSTIPERVSYGVQGLRRAIDKFEGDFEGKLSTYAVRWIKNAMQRKGLEKGRGRSNSEVLSLDAPFGKKQDQKMIDTIGSHEPDPSCNAQINEMRERVHAMLAVLKPHEREVIEKLFFVSEDNNQTTVGREMGVTKTRIYQIQRDAFRRMRESGILSAEELSEYEISA